MAGVYKERRDCETEIEKVPRVRRARLLIPLLMAIRIGFVWPWLRRPIRHLSAHCARSSQARAAHWPTAVDSLRLPDAHRSSSGLFFPPCPMTSTLKPARTLCTDRFVDHAKYSPRPSSSSNSYRTIPLTLAHIMTTVVQITINSAPRRHRRIPTLIKSASLLKCPSNSATIYKQQAAHPTNVRHEHVREHHPGLIIVRY